MAQQKQFQKESNQNQSQQANLKPSEGEEKVLLEKILQNQFNTFINQSNEQGKRPIQKINQEEKQKLMLKEKKMDLKNQKYIAQDERQKVQDPFQYPYSSIGYIEIDFGDYRTWGTGCLIMPNVVLTSAENVFDKITSSQPKSIYFVPAMSGKHGQKIKIKNRYYPEKYKSTTKILSFFYNYAVLHLQCTPILAWKYGYLGIFSQWQDYNEPVYNYGYPCDLNNKINNTSWNQKVQFGQIGNIIYSKTQTDGTSLQLNIKTASGQNGSPIFIKTKNNHYRVVGIQIQYELKNKNIALKIDNKIKQDIKKWIKQMVGTPPIQWKTIHINHNIILEEYYLKLEKIQIDLPQKSEKISNEFLISLSKLTWLSLQKITLSIKFNSIDNTKIITIQKLNAPQLKILQFKSSKIGKIINLSNLTTLKRLSLCYFTLIKLKIQQKKYKIYQLQLTYSFYIQDKIKQKNYKIYKIQVYQDYCILVQYRIILDANQISKIQNVDSLVNLQGLYLQYNKIQKIQNLQNLKQLKTLWLRNLFLNQKETILIMFKISKIQHI